MEYDSTKYLVWKTLFPGKLIREENDRQNWAKCKKNEERQENME